MVKLKLILEVKNKGMNKVNNFKGKRALSFAIIFFVYVIATLIGVITYKLIDNEFYIKLLIADICSTITVFIFSLILRNSSVYDPYWSVAPCVILILYSFNTEMNLGRILSLICVIIWGVRLTLNWAYTFIDLNKQDWRYSMLEQKSGKLYPFVNFWGIHFFPTIVVYTCILPIVFSYNSNIKVNFFSILFFVTGLLSVLLQGISDLEMHRFRKQNNGGLIRFGLWKYSRHPNYLGEILMWWSMGLMQVTMLGGKYYLLIGALINTLMFVFISIPLAENHQADRKEGFKEYKEQTRMLLPIKK